MVQMYGISREQQCAVVRKKLAELHHRLENGWKYVGENPSDQNAFDLYLTILKNYEKRYFEWLTLGGNEKEGYL